MLQVPAWVSRVLLPETRGSTWGFKLCVKSETAFLEQVPNSGSLWTSGGLSLAFPHPKCPEEGGGGGGGPGGQLAQE